MNIIYFAIVGKNIIKYIMELSCLNIEINVTSKDKEEKVLDY